jgi:hypothetical protein
MEHGLVIAFKNAAEHYRLFSRLRLSDVPFDVSVLFAGSQNGGWVLDSLFSLLGGALLRDFGYKLVDRMLTHGEVSLVSEWG